MKSEGDIRGALTHCKVISKHNFAVPQNGFKVTPGAKGQQKYPKSSRRTVPVEGTHHRGIENDHDTSSEVSIWWPFQPRPLQTLFTPTDVVKSLTQRGRRCERWPKGFSKGASRKGREMWNASQDGPQRIDLDRSMEWNPPPLVDSDPLEVDFWLGTVSQYKLRFFSFLLSSFKFFFYFYFFGEHGTDMPGAWQDPLFILTSTRGGSRLSKGLVMAMVSLGCPTLKANVTHPTLGVCFAHPLSGCVL